MLAVRYLNPLRSMFSIITLICLGGVALGVMVLIVVLSVMEGLQKEMETRTLAFTPHYVVSLYEQGRLSTLTEEDTNWPSIVDKISRLPGVVSVYPLIEQDSFLQGENSRLSARMQAIDPSNHSQMFPLLPMLRAGSFDFGEGLDQECVISAQVASALHIGIGDQVHITPVGSIDRVATIYSMIQTPLLTQRDDKLLPSLRGIFENSSPARGGERVPAEKLQALADHINEYSPDRLRRSERDLLGDFYTDALNHIGDVPFTPDEKKRWFARIDALAALDRDKEDGKEVKSINEMVMPMDLNVVGIYQPPENMPGPGIFIPLTIAQDLVGYGSRGMNEVMGLCVRIEDPNMPGNLEQSILELLPDLSGSTENHPVGRMWSVSSWTHNLAQWFKLIANERTMMSFVLSIISLIASFCIMAVMFTMSLQRKREIAVLQALGATPGKIMAIFTWQGIIIGIGGAVMGIVLALLVLYYRLEIQAALAGIGLDPFPMQAHGITLPAEYNPATFARQAIMAFMMVTIAAIIPAFFISRQDPAKALRSN